MVPARRKKSQRGKAWPITITFDRSASLLSITEARYGLKSFRVPADGEWPDRVQIDGYLFRRMVATFHGNVMLELVVTADDLCIAHDNTIVRLVRIDSTWKPAVIRRDFPPNRRHKGPVEMPPDRDPRYTRVELDATWPFSARMPVPQHRIIKKYPGEP